MEGGGHSAAGDRQLSSLVWLADLGFQSFANLHPTISTPPLRRVVLSLELF